MAAFRIRVEMVNTVLGIANMPTNDEESSLSTINVYLDNMWREETRKHANLINIHGEDLEKVIRFSQAWKAQGKTFVSKMKFEYVKGKGVPEQIVREINAAPAALAKSCAADGRLIFCHSPCFHFIRKQNTFELSVWLHAVFSVEATT